MLRIVYPRRLPKGGYATPLDSPKTQVKGTPILLCKIGVKVQGDFALRPLKKHCYSLANGNSELLSHR
jgi:hypothetical protein